MSYHWGLCCAWSKKTAWKMAKRALKYSRQTAASNGVQKTIEYTPFGDTKTLTADTVKPYSIVHRYRKTTKRYNLIFK
jgi:hypothetical protein